MRKSLVPAGIFLAFIAVCGGGVWWFFQPPGRHIGSFDIGNGLTVRIWSEGEWIEPHVGMYYEIVENGKIVCPTTWFGVDHGQQFEFKTASADGDDEEKLRCLYEVNSARNTSEFLIIYEIESRESWPRMGDGEQRGDPAVMRKWHERYWKLRDANPGFPRGHYLADVAAP